MQCSYRVVVKVKKDNTYNSYMFILPLIYTLFKNLQNNIKKYFGLPKKKKKRFIITTFPVKNIVANRMEKINLKT